MKPEVFAKLKTHFTKFTLDQAPFDSRFRAKKNLYIFLPWANLYGIFIRQGEKVSDEKKAKLLKHRDPFVYIDDRDMSSIDPTQPGSQLAAQAEVVKNIVKSLESGDFNPAEIISKIEGASEDAVRDFAVDPLAAKKALLKLAPVVADMEDSAGLLIIAMLFCIANSFNSMSSLKDISQAIMLMDMDLEDLTPDERKSYYLDKPNWQDPLKTKIHNHPSISTQKMQDKLPKISESVLMLIRNHHEIYSGKGFPKGVRTETIPPMARILSLAVDVFESIKKASLNEQIIGFYDALLDFKNEKVEGHLRRHNRKLVDDTIKFFNS